MNFMIEMVEAMMFFHKHCFMHLWSLDGERGTDILRESWCFEEAGHGQWSEISVCYSTDVPVR